MLKKTLELHFEHYLLAVISLVLCLIAVVATMLLAIIAPTSLLYFILNQSLLFPVGLFFSLVLVATCSQYGYMTIGHEITFLLIRKIRLALYKKIINVPLVVWHKWRHGDILQRIMHNLELFDGALLRVVMPFSLIIIISHIWIIWVAFSFSLYLALAEFSLMVFYVFMVIRKHKARLELQEEIEVNLTNIRSATIEASEARLQIALFGASKKISNLLIGYSYKNQVIQSRQFELEDANATYGSILVLSGFVFVVFWWQANLFEVSWQHIALLLSTIPVLTFVTQLPQVQGYYIKTLVALKILREMLKQTDKKETPTTQNIASDFTSSIQIDDIKFSYNKNTESIFNELSCDIKPNQTWLVTGKSGMGKSSLLHIIAGHYAVNNGSVRVAGVPVEQLKSDDLQQLITLVPQDYYIFYCSVADNMHLASPKATTEQMQKALEQVNLDDWLAGLENGLNTKIGKGAVELSGGQLRRFMLACALLRDTPIWLIDEPTANLDKQNAKLIAKLINKLITDKTAIIVTHKYQELFTADVSATLESGKFFIKT